MITENIQRALVVIVSILICTQASAEILPCWPLEYSVLESDLIIEGNVTGDKSVTVTVTRVYTGSAKIGDVIPLSRLTNLPSIAYEKPDLGSKKTNKGIPTEGKTAVLFLVKKENQTTYQPFGWGSGVKWLLNKKVYGYTQSIRPGPYQLTPDLSTPTVEKLRHTISTELKKRKGFETVLREKNPDVKAKKLTFYIQPSESYFYFNKAVGILQTLGHSGALVCSQELVRPEQEKHRRDLIIAIGRSKDKGSTPFLLSIIDKAKPLVIDMEGGYNWSKANEKERHAMSDWQIAIYAAAEIGDARALVHFREAAVWGAKNRDQNMLEYSVRGMKNAPTAMNLPTFKKIFTLLPKEAEGFGKHTAYYTLLSLIDHKYRDAIPILASQLDHPDEYNQRQAHRGLEGIVGQDLGRKKEPWLNWYAKNEK